MEEVIRKAPTFMELLQQIEDPRDNRGKRHELACVLACVIVAMLSDKSSMSSIHRFIRDRIEWLREIVQRSTMKVVSRAQLPKIVAVVDWNELNTKLEQFFSFRIEHADGEWKAIDGKSLKGTIVDPTQAHQHERIVSVVTHTSHEVLYQRQFSGAKESEVTIVRDLLETSGLAGDSVSLDAGHANPTTFEQIHQAGGRYVVQIKKNQPQLFKTLEQMAEQAEQTEQTKQTEQTESSGPGVLIATIDKGHGRLEERVGRVLSLKTTSLAERWEPTGMCTLIVMDRFTEELKTGKTSAERSYYVSNQPSADHERELFDAIRGHWRVESTNYIRDVTFNEDHIRTKHPNQGQILSLLRTVALKCIQQLQPTNVKAMLEKFANVPDSLRDLLVDINVVSAS